jgi:hypothetical protein
MENEKAFEKSVAFLNAIGIEVKFQPIEYSTFLPGVSIENGSIVIDKEKMKYPGDVLHEAGHIAVVPAADRTTITEHSIAERKDREAEEMMAIAWSYAVCVHLKIDAAFVFHDDGYKGGGSSIADNFKEGRYFGVPMLQWVGMTLDEKNAIEKGQSAYPAMLQWMRN